jgi:hypothetical protein
MKSIKITKIKDGRSNFVNKYCKNENKQQKLHVKEKVEITMNLKIDKLSIVIYVENEHIRIS